MGADGGTFLLKSGTVVALSAPLETGNARLQVQPGSGPFDRIKRIVASPSAGSQTGRLVAMTDAFDSSTSADRYAAVWSRRSSSVIGFVDVDRSTGKRQELPLFELRLAADVAYYQPAPDTNAGRMTVLAHVGGTARVMWIDVGI